MFIDKRAISMFERVSERENEKSSLFKKNQQMLKKPEWWKSWRWRDKTKINYKTLHLDSKLRVVCSFRWSLQFLKFRPYRVKTLYLGCRWSTAVAKVKGHKHCNHGDRTAERMRIVLRNCSPDVCSHWEGQSEWGLCLMNAVRVLIFMADF